MTVGIINYGMGNLQSIISTLKYLEVENIVLSSSYDELKGVDKCILPGVGSFNKAMENIRALKLDECLTEMVVHEKKPILGICLGMQLLCKESLENGFSEGLSLVDGKIDKFISDTMRIPHVGFNQVSITKDSKLYNGIYDGADFYFTHSYKMSSHDKDINASYCDYIDKFIASFEFENIAGVQFHPELSQTNGLKLLKNFLERF